MKNSYGKSLVLGITAILGVQFVWNILFNLGLAVGGVSLPFISYSGTSIIINMFIVGIIINVYKETYADIRFIQSKVVESPIVEGCNRYYECKVVFKLEIDLEKIHSETIYKDGECEHTMYFGEIVE